MRKQISIISLLLAMLLLFCSCKKEKATCEELVLEGLEYGIEGYSENGYIFLKSADESSAFFMTERTKRILYGERFSYELDAAKDFAIYISASSPYEVAVFECYSKNDANEILRMCYERTDEIKVGLRFSKWESQSKFIALQTYGRYVIFAFTDSYERNRETVDKIISLLH